MIRLSRPAPAGPPEAYKTYAAVAPLRTHWRRATCAEFECGAYERGWRTILPADDVRCDYIRARSGRRFTESRDEAGQVVFTFPPGQVCFGADDHRVPLGKPALYVVRRGDYRSWRPLYRHSGPDPWMDDMRTSWTRALKERE